MDTEDFWYYDGDNIKAPLAEDYYQTYFYRDGKVLTEKEVTDLCPTIKFPLPPKLTASKKASLGQAGILFQRSLNKKEYDSEWEKVKETFLAREEEFKTALFDELCINPHMTNTLTKKEVFEYIYMESRVTHTISKKEVLDSQKTYANFKKYIMFARGLLKVCQK